MNDKDTVVDTYTARRDAVMRGLASFCESTPDFDMSARMRRSAAEHILGMVDLAAAPSTSVREEVLEAALKPFAEAADDLDEEHRDGSDIWEASVGMSITAGDLRHARAVLKPSTDKGGVE